MASAAPDGKTVHADLWDAYVAAWEDAARLPLFVPLRFAEGRRALGSLGRVVAADIDEHRNTYEAEDRAWNAIGVRKPREFPLDVVSLSFAAFLFAAVPVGTAISEGDVQWGVILAAAFFVLLAILHPVLTLRRRGWR